jgi:hypothetical protein
MREAEQIITPLNREADIHFASHETPNLLWNLKIDYHLHNNARETIMLI